MSRAVENTKVIIITLLATTGTVLVATGTGTWVTTFLLLLQLALQLLVGFGFCFTISFHNLLSLHFSIQFLTFIFFKSSSTCSRHLNFGLPTGFDEHCSHSVCFLTVLFVSILITCAAQRNLYDFINLTIVSFLIRISNSSFVFILHVPSLSCVGPIIF